MKSLIFIISLIIQINVSAGEISRVFGDGVFETKWGQTINDVKIVFGLFRDKGSKIHFSFDSEKRLNGVAVYFKGEQFSSLLLKLNTLFGQFVKQGSGGVTYMQWESDNSVIITLSAVPSPYDLAAIFSIGYYGLDKPDISKDELGF